jgi:branched-chain amino acid transport system permease protein
MMGGYIALSLLLIFGFTYALVIPVTLVAMALGGAVFQRVVMERVSSSKGVGVQLVIATLGLAYALKGLVRQTGLGDTPRSLPALVPTDAILIGDAVLT